MIGSADGPHIFNVILPILLCITVGYGLAKLKQPFDNQMVTSVMANVGYPTLILSHLLGHQVDVQIFLTMLLAALVFVVCVGLVWSCLLRLYGLPIKVFLSPLSLSNVGNVGLPICALAAGPEGLVYGLAFVVVVIVLTFTVSQWVTSGDYSLRALVSSPTVYASMVAVAMLMLDLSFPKPVADALNILGGLAIPLMLLTLGYSLATLKLGDLSFAIRFSVLHLLVAAAVAYVLVGMFNFSGTARTVFIIECLMPISAATYLWVDKYRPEHAPAVASLVLITTLMTIIVLPLALSYWV
ncbi:MAG: AEC family transporter [Pseudomonadota bacterium]